MSFYQALPGPMIDLVRDGVHPAELRREGPRAVWRALVRTAASATQRGWDCWQWQELVEEPASGLGRQMATRDGRRPSTKQSIAKTLAAAWDAGTAWASEQPPPWTRAQAVEQATRRADLVAELAADPAAPFAPEQRAVLAHAAARARELGTDRPALPRKGMLAATGLGLTALRTALARLEERGLLVLAERGRRGASSKHANLYQLPREEHPALAAYLYRETRYVVPPGQVCSAPRDAGDGAPAQVCSAPLYQLPDRRPTWSP